MQVQPIKNSINFQGKIQVNPLFNKFKEELNPIQKDIFEKQIEIIEKEKDGRIFKFDRFVNPYESGGAEVGIFEQKALINDTYWIPLFCSKRENATRCFDQLHKMYKDVQLAK